MCGLYPATLLNSFVSSQSVFTWFCRVFYTQDRVGCKWRCFNSSLIWTPSIALASVLQLTLNVKSGHPCLVPDATGNIFSPLPLSMELAVGLSQGPDHVEGVPSHSEFIERFYDEKVLDRSNAFFSSSSWGGFSSLCKCDVSRCFLHKSHLAVMCHPLTMFVSEFSSLAFCWGFLHLYLWEILNYIFLFLSFPSGFLQPGQCRPCRMS